MAHIVRIRTKIIINMTHGLFKSLCAAAVVCIAAGCGSNAKKAEAEKAAEQARLDSLKQAEMIQKQKDAEEMIGKL